PKLQQALKLLQMPAIELQQMLKQEIMENPLLEEVEDFEETVEHAAESRERRRSIRRSPPRPRKRRRRRPPRWTAPPPSRRPPSPRSSRARKKTAKPSPRRAGRGGETAAGSKTLREQ